MATRAPEQIARTGLKETYHPASAGGDKFNPGDNVYVRVVNGSAAAITPTFVTPNTVIGQAIADVAVPVPANDYLTFGPFPPEHFAGSDGLVSVTWSATATVTFAVLRG